MSELITELKAEHLEIISALNKVNEVGINSQEGQAKLWHAKPLILTHLKKEKEKFFPFFREKVEKNKELKKTLELSANKLENVTIDAHRFFDKYPERDSNITFIGEFIAFFTALKARIQDEEEFLFREYEKIIN